MYEKYREKIRRTVAYRQTARLISHNRHIQQQICQLLYAGQFLNLLTFFKP